MPWCGMVKAADRITVHISQGEFVGIVGANGSGKTTFLNLITGYLTPDHGRILLMGQDSTGLPPRLVTRLGLARSFQIPQLYTALSVLENVLLALAAQARQSTGFWKPLYRRQWLEEGMDILARFGLTSYASRSVAELPEGGRKLLDVALSFALKPRVLLMDEPTIWGSCPSLAARCSSTARISQACRDTAALPWALVICRKTGG